MRQWAATHVVGSGHNHPIGLGQSHLVNHGPLNSYEGRGGGGGGGHHHGRHGRHHHGHRHHGGHHRHHHHGGHRHHHHGGHHHHHRGGGGHHHHHHHRRRRFFLELNSQSDILDDPALLEENEVNPEEIILTDQTTTAERLSLLEAAADDFSPIPKRSKFVILPTLVTKINSKKLKFCRDQLKLAFGPTPKWSPWWKDAKCLSSKQLHRVEQEESERLKAKKSRKKRMAAALAACLQDSASPKVAKINTKTVVIAKKQQAKVQKKLVKIVKRKIEQKKENERHQIIAEARAEIPRHPIHLPRAPPSPYYPPPPPQPVYYPPPPAPIRERIREPEPEPKPDIQEIKEEIRREIEEEKEEKEEQEEEKEEQEEIRHHQEIMRHLAPPPRRHVHREKPDPPQRKGPVWQGKRVNVNSLGQLCPGCQQIIYNADSPLSANDWKLARMAHADIVVGETKVLAQDVLDQAVLTVDDANAARKALLDQYPAKGSEY